MLGDATRPAKDAHRQLFVVASQPCGMSKLDKNLYQENNWRADALDRTRTSTITGTFGAQIAAKVQARPATRRYASSLIQQNGCHSCDVKSLYVRHRWVPDKQ